MTTTKLRSMKISINTERDVISQYIYAKDYNRPHLMASAFTSDARLEIQLKTQNIDFPTESIGRGAITETLSSNFGRQYENVYTFCISESLVKQDSQVSCLWLVAMTEKANGLVRVGCGQYEWHFVRESSLLADRLRITIEEMLVLEPHVAPEVLDWVSGLAYPWCEGEEVLNSMPSLEALSTIRQRII